ncbi:hypothetical protein RRG08_027728 [Elysia crispata]|uniref:Uncharacterized protein n=1 Tax=Elysia crispata TaxID=231223 RepID=A0AAE0YA68_9GAST|nr:hypothetical protein RRG08_027728 [Elysia crispata]
MYEKMCRVYHTKGKERKMLDILEPRTKQSHPERAALAELDKSSCFICVWGWPAAHKNRAICLWHLRCALQIDRKPVCVTYDVRSRSMENQFVSTVMCPPDRWRTSLCDVRSRLMENQFVSPVMCASDRWRTSLRHLRCALQIDGEQV